MTSAAVKEKKLARSIGFFRAANSSIQLSRREKGTSMRTFERQQVGCRIPLHEILGARYFGFGVSRRKRGLKR